MVALDVRPREMSPLASSHDVLVRRCTEELERRGKSWRQITRRHGVRLPDKPGTGMRVPSMSELAVLRDAELEADDPYFGWSLGEFSFRDLGVYGYSVLNSPDVRSALTTAIELFRLLSEGPQMGLQERDGEAWLTQTVNLGTGVNQVGLRMRLSHMRELAGPDFKPLRVGVPETDAVRLSGLSDLAGVRVEASEHAISYVTFPADVLNRPLHQADRQLAITLRRIWDEERQRLAERSHTMGRLQKAILSTLPEGEPRLDRVAESLSVSPKTLRTELNGLGTSLPRITDMVRASVAGALMAEPGMTPARVAKALGYAEAGALMRAQGRWFGTTTAARGRTTDRARRT
ncbi:MAG: AraC family transcriptional regulator ligand-binding domain-containing protein [Geminicoccaceae bacterium]